jgi:hypothetical protein
VKKEIILVEERETLYSTTLCMCYCILLFLLCMVEIKIPSLLFLVYIVGFYHDTFVLNLTMNTQIVLGMKW